MSSVRLAVIDREGFYIDAVMSVLEQQPDMDVIANATIFEDFVAHAQGAEIVVLQQEESVSLTRKLIKDIQEKVPGAEVIVLGASEDVGVLVSYLEAGAIGYVRDSESFDQLLQIIRVVHAGETLLHPEIAAPLVRRLGELGQMAQDFFPVSAGDIELTERQQEVMELIAAGMTNQEIAEDLDISVGTVKNHVHKIFERLQVNSREQATAVYERAIAEREEARADGRKRPRASTA